VATPSATAILATSGTEDAHTFTVSSSHWLYLLLSGNLFQWHSSDEGDASVLTAEGATQNQLSQIPSKTR